MLVCNKKLHAYRNFSHIIAYFSKKNYRHYFTKVWNFLSRKVTNLQQSFCAKKIFRFFNLSDKNWGERGLNIFCANLKKNLT